jgi:hypothetical protein
LSTPCRKIVIFILYTSACANFFTYLGYIIAFAGSCWVFAWDRKTTNTFSLVTNLLFLLGSTAAMYFFLSFGSFRKNLAKYIYRGEKAEVAYQYLGSLCDSPHFIADNIGL